MDNHSISIDAKNVTVEYRTAKYRTSTLKEFVINALKGRNSVSVHRALDSVSVKIEKGESVALIGHNGSGKSTLLKVLAGIIQPPGAEVNVQGRIAPMIELGAGFDGELSGIENIYLSCTLMGLSRAEIDKRLDSIVRFAELKDFIEMPFKNFSSGMQARLGFACATAVDPDIILADEVLAVGDSNFAKKCLFRIEELREKGASLILVSHDPSAVKRFCSRAYVFNRGKCVFEGHIEEAFEFNDRIMDLRLQEHLTESEINEMSRKRALEADAKSSASGVKTQRPKVNATAEWVQLGQATDIVKTNLPFSLKFGLETLRAEHFEEQITVGFALQTLSGQRIFGRNNLSFSKPLLRQEFTKIQPPEKVSVEFNFPEGTQEIASGVYELVIGVHDKNLTRTILHEKMGNVRFLNEIDPNNHDNDAVQILSKMNVTIDGL